VNVIPFLYRHPETGYFEPRPCAYDGPVSLKVWKRLNRQFLKLNAGNYFWPSDGADAYGEAITSVCTAAGKIVRGEIVLKNDSPDPYLTGVAFKALYRYHLREVMPQRAVYRAVEKQTIGNGAVGEDGFDIDNHNGAEDYPDKTMTDACGDQCIESIPVGSALTAQQLVESLPGFPDARERQEKALNCLDDLCRAMTAADPKNEEAVDAFAAYIVAECDMVEAARLIHVPKTTYYRKWPAWLAAAKKVGKNKRCYGTN